MEDAREPYRSESTLVVAISSRALFDLADSHVLFEREGVDAFARYQDAARRRRRRAR
jgi:5'-nucleotidase